MGLSATSKKRQLLKPEIRERKLLVASFNCGLLAVSFHAGLLAVSFRFACG